MRGHKLQLELHGIAPLVGAALVGAAANIFGQDRANRGNIKEAARQREFESGQAQRSMDFESSQAQANRAWQETQAAKQMSFQERMSSSAHQRAMSDLRKAGLNPILAAKQPASAPGGAMGSGAQARGSMARGVRAEVRNIFQGIDASTAGNVMQAEASIQVVEAQANLTIEKLETEDITQAVKVAERALKSLSFNEKQLYIEMLKEQTKIAVREGNVAASKAGVFFRWIREGLGSVGSVWTGERGGSYSGPSAR